MLVLAQNKGKTRQSALTFLMSFVMHETGLVTTWCQLRNRLHWPSMEVHKVMTHGLMALCTTQLFAPAKLSAPPFFSWFAHSCVQPLAFVGG